MQGEELRGRRAELDAMHPISQCLKVPVAQSYQNKVSFHTSWLAVAACVRDATRHRCSVSLHQRVWTFVRDWEVRRHFFVACQFMSFPPFSCHFPPSFLRFQEIFLYWKHQLLSTACILKVSPPVCERSFCFLCGAFDIVLHKNLHIMKYIHLLFSCLYILRQLESFVLPRLKRNLTIFYPNNFVFSITKNVHV